MKVLRFRFSTVVSAMAMATILLVGCNRDEVAPSVSADALDVASASSVSEQTVADLQTIGDEASGGTSLKSFRLDDSAIVPSHDRFRFMNDSLHIEVDFGANTLCNDGKIRKGKVNILRINPPSRDSIGGAITFQTDGYEVNGFKVDLTKTVTRLGWFNDDAAYPNGYVKYLVVVANGSITRPNGDVITLNVDHTYKLIATADTLTFAGWAISGTSSHTVLRASTSKTLGVLTTITQELLRPLKYHHFVAGEFVSEFLSGKTVTVNYGSGNLFDSTTWSSNKVITSDGGAVTATQE